MYCKTYILRKNYFCKKLEVIFQVSYLLIPLSCEGDGGRKEAISIRVFLAAFSSTYSALIICVISKIAYPFIIKHRRKYCYTWLLNDDKF